MTIDPKKSQNKPMNRPGPYRSKLTPCVDQIKAWRRAGKTWQQVTEELAKLDPPVITDPASAYRFIKRWRKKPYPFGSDQAPESAPPSPAGPAAPPASPTLTKPAAPGRDPRFSVDPEVDDIFGIYDPNKKHDKTNE
jgi:hypothetical protein